MSVNVSMPKHRDHRAEPERKEEYLALIRRQAPCASDMQWIDGIGKVGGSGALDCVAGLDDQLTCL
jgi:hypothetical protein